MHVLFTFVGGTGHYEPLVPIANAMAAAGHEVSFACRLSMVATVEADGFVAAAIGPDVPDLPAIAPLVPVDEAHEEAVVRYGFARRTARHRCSDLLTLCAGRRPDLIVSDEADYGAPIAAEVLGIPHVTVLVLITGSFARPDVISDQLNLVRAEHGLPPDPELAMLKRRLVIAPFPTSMCDPAFPLPSTAVCIRPSSLGTSPSGRTVRSTGDRPRVYFTLGTIFNMESGDLFERVLRGLYQCDVDVLATVGRQLDPAVLGPQPEHVRIERFIPQAEVLATTDVVICHGGSGSVLGALAHGLPMLVLPMGADQPHNARRCEQLGVALVRRAIDVTPTEIRDAVNELLQDPGYRERARSIEAEIAALPSAESLVRVLEQIVGDRSAE